MHSYPAVIISNELQSFSETNSEPSQNLFGIHIFPLTLHFIVSVVYLSHKSFLFSKLSLNSISSHLDACSHFSPSK